jgi:hypothetical protein
MLMNFSPRFSIEPPKAPRAPNFAGLILRVVFAW